MVLFTIEDYYKYAPYFASKLTLAEESEQYSINKNITHQYQDKIFKEVLDNRKELINFIKKYLKNNKFGKIKEEEIESYNPKFITSKFRIKESDMIYKIKNKNIFILIEHQSKIDYDMPLRITEYCVELMRSIRKNNNKCYAVIYPIVLYTGKKKWDAPLTMENFEEDAYEYGIPTINYQKYNLVDINDYTKEELIKENTAISKALLFEKLETDEEINRTIKTIRNKKLSVEELKYIKMILTYSNKVKNAIGLQADKYIEELEKEEEKSMRVLEYMITQYLKGEKEGKEVRKI